MDGVKEQRTSWRDEELSLRHREWGFDCPAVDIDFLLIEYNHAKVKALVEYKKEFAYIPNTSHHTFRAIADLGDRADIPVFLCVYSGDLTTYTVTALNDKARQWCPEDNTVFSEYEWVKLLYDVRGYGAITLDVQRRLKRRMRTVS